MTDDDILLAEEELSKQTRWCYGCDEIKPLTPEYWCYANKEHTRFRTKCRKCTNYDSMISHRIHRKKKGDKNE